MTMEHQPQQSTDIHDLLTILADKHCRDVVASLRESSEDVASVTTLATDIRNQDHGGTEPLAIQLHHSTLPRLAEAGVIDYDTRQNTVRYRGHPELEALTDDIVNY